MTGPPAGHGHIIGSSYCAAQHISSLFFAARNNVNKNKIFSINIQTLNIQKTAGYAVMEVT